MGCLVLSNPSRCSFQRGDEGSMTTSHVPRRPFIIPEVIWHKDLWSALMRPCGPMQDTRQIWVLFFLIQVVLYHYYYYSVYPNIIKWQCFFFLLGLQCFFRQINKIWIWIFFQKTHFHWMFALNTCKNNMTYLQEKRWQQCKKNHNRIYCTTKFSM